VSGGVADSPSSTAARSGDEHTGQAAVSSSARYTVRLQVGQWAVTVTCLFTHGRAQGSNRRGLHEVGPAETGAFAMVALSLHSAKGEAMSGGGIDGALSVRESVGAAISCIPAVASGRWRVLGFQTHRVLPRIGKRVSILSVTFLDEGSRFIFDDGIVVKQYDGVGAPAGHNALLTLWGAGFRPPSFYCVSRPYGFSSARRHVVEQFVPGPSLIKLVPSSGGAAAGVAAMEWLLQLQSSELPLQQGPPDRFLRPLDEGMEQLQPLESCLRTELNASADPIVPSHGDFHLKNLLRHNDSIVSIDVDKLGMREASFDVGDAIGQLLVMSHFGYGTLARGVEVAAAMWSRYRESGVATAERTALHTARSILRSLIFKYRLAQAAGEEPPVLDPWLHLARHFVEARDPAVVCSSVSQLNLYR
jgi:hypothetical protein